MKCVSFEVAKAIKEAGYPQKCGLWYNKKGIEFSYTEDYSECYARPTYLDVWLWLWREKKNAIPADYFGYENNYWSSCVPLGDGRFEFFEPLHDPEEAIIKAIDYVVDNDLIK